MRSLALLLACACSANEPPPEQPAIEQPPLEPSERPPSPDSDIGHGHGIIPDEHGSPLGVPTVRMDKVQILGSMPSDIVRRIVRARMGDVSDCYHTALERDANLQGRITFTFEIDRIGRVLAPAVAESDILDKTIGPCIVRAIRRWKFPSDGHGIALVRHSFLFEPG